MTRRGKRRDLEMEGCLSSLSVYSWEKGGSPTARIQELTVFEDVFESSVRFLLTWKFVVYKGLKVFAQQQLKQSRTF